VKLANAMSVGIKISYIAGDRHDLTWRQPWNKVGECSIFIYPYHHLPTGILGGGQDEW